jgi:GT2 family glycosyltransferase
MEKATKIKSACILNLENGHIVKESIERLLAEDTEVIVVDNNSQDGTREILKSFENRIIYKILPEIRGQSENRNWMIRQSHGKYILLLDGDILYEPKTFDYLIQRLEMAPPEVKCIGFDPWYYTNVREEVQKELPSLNEELSTHGQPIALTQYGVFKRELFDKYDIWFDENYGVGYGCEDNDFAFQMLKYGFVCRSIPFKYYHNKHTEHWYSLHTPERTRTKEREEYLCKKWGAPLVQRYFRLQYYKSDKIDDYPRVMVGVGICPRTEYARDLFMEWFKKQSYQNVELFIDENNGEENARASRQRIRDRFISSNCDYLLFCDVDTIPPLDAIPRLLKANKDIITGLTVSRLDPTVIAFWKEGYPEQQQKKELIKTRRLIEIDGAGLYLTLVKRPVLEQIKFDWNDIVDDIEFFNRAKALGYKIYLDPTVQCKHYRDKNNFYQYEAENNN